MLAITWFVFPETKTHSLEEIAKVFDGPSSITGDVGLGKDNNTIAKGEHVVYAAA